MKAQSALLVPLVLTFALLAGWGCNPIQPSSHPGSPPAVNAIRPKPILSPPPRVVGNVKPPKYGVPYILDYARNQAGMTEIEIKPDQFQFGRVAGRDQAQTHRDEQKRLHPKNH
jgi:hypothetical protein